MLPILPPAPSRTDPTNFSAKADAWVDALDEWTDAANALEQSLQLVATTGTSTSSLPIGTGSKGLTTQTGKAWGVGSWVYIASASSITNLMQGQVTAYNSGTGNLVVNVTQSTGSGTYTDWVIALASPTTNSANLSGGVAGSIPYQSGVNTTTMLSPGTAGQILISNGGSAPSWGDNTRLINIQYLSTGTYTPTAGTRRVVMRLIGGGGGSSGTPSTSAGQIVFNESGNAGALVEFESTFDWSGATVTIGGAGTAGTAGGSGGDGGTTTISKSGYFVDAGGGKAGSPQSVLSSFPGRASVTNKGANGSPTSISSLTKITKVIPSFWPDEALALSVSSGYLPKSPSILDSYANNQWFIGLGSNSLALGQGSGVAGSGGPWMVSGPSSASRVGYAGYAGRLEVYEYA